MSHPEQSEGSSEQSEGSSEQSEGSSEQSEGSSEQSEDLSEQSEGSFREYEGSWSRSDSRCTPAGFRMRPVVILSSARDLTLQLERKKDSRRSLEITMPGSLNSASSATCNAIGSG